MNLRKIVAKYFYFDRADVYRAKLNTIGLTDDYTEEYELIYSQVPCHLAVTGEKSAAHRDDVSQKITINLRLDYDPQYTILPNDYLTVNHRGFIFNLIAGTQMNYITHAELDVKRRLEAGQN